MALSSTSFAHASIATKVKMAMHEAAFGHGQAYVHNRRGKPILSVRYRPGDAPQAFAFFIGNKNVSAIVMEGLRQFHRSAQ